MSLVQSEAISAAPWANFTQGGAIVDGATSSHDALLSGKLMGGND